MPETPAAIEIALGVHALLGGVNSAIITAPGGRAILVDSGQDKDAGRRIKRALGELGLEPAYLINTHSHADHYGGNAYLIRQFPALQVLAPAIEANIMRAPYLEPVYLFHGAKPPPELLSKWLMAEASAVHQEIEAGPLELAGVLLELLDTRGHSHRQLAVKVGDVMLAADAVFGAETLARYPLPFSQDVGSQLASFDAVAEAGVRLVLPGHGSVSSDVAGLVRSNREAVERAVALVLAAVDGHGTEEVLATIYLNEAGGLAMDDLPRYHLNLCTVSAYLGYLRSMGQVELVLDQGRLSWHRA